MDTLRSDAASHPLPARVRDELTDVDRLRTIWAGQRDGRPREARAAARQELVHRRVRELGGGPGLVEAVLSVSREGMAGQPVCADYVMQLSALAAALPTDRACRVPERRLDWNESRNLAEAAELPAHPVVRAAHVLAGCADLLGATGTSPDDGLPWVLPWMLASAVLQRACYPPLLPDPLALRPPVTVREPGERLAGLVHHVARLATGTLRDELCWVPAEVPEPRGSRPPLASVTCRRIEAYVRSRGEALDLMLRAMDPRAGTTVRSGGSGDAPRQDPGSAPASRTVLTPGAAHWWTSLELVAGDASLTLFVVVQEVGRPETGVLAVTADGRLTTPEGVRDTLDMSRADSVTVIPTDSVDERWPEIRDLVDEAVSRSMNALTRV
ncbi:hypothetical protein [Nocardiopsis sp. CNT312]|uniref:hypothetical protein n=1 Tax=Nocardiopsis sp. CNT312 TaxID=1137268 RepID=UPI00048C6BBF|nr:hypothetical protein [Nocardiopsis sp. CNT312]